MFPVLLRPDLVLIQKQNLAVHPHPGVSVPADPVQEFHVFPLPAPDHRRQNHEFCPLRKSHDGIHDLIHTLAGDGPAAYRAVRPADPRIEKPQIVVNLGDGSHSGAGVLAGGFLIDGNGRGKSLNGLHIRLVHLPQELPGIGRKALDVPALSLCVDGFECQGGLPGTGESGEHHQLVPGNPDAEMLQIVDIRIFDNDFIRHIFITPVYFVPLSGSGGDPSGRSPE